MSAINTPYATLSFANIFTPRPRAEGGTPVYSCSLIFDPQQQKSPAYKALQDACIAAARKEWGDNVQLKGINMPFRDAGEKSYDGYHAGHTFISPWSKNKPGVVDTNVHFSDSVRLAQRLIELRKENWELAPYPVENHGFERASSWADEYKRILKLFEDNLRVSAKNGKSATNP